MYKINKNGTTLAMTEAPTYIKRAENGCLVLCLEPDAEGIAYAGKVYHLEGRPDMDGAETVSLERVDAGAEISKANEAGRIVFVTMAEAGTIDPITAADHADFFMDWAAGVKYTTGQIRRHKDGNLYKCLSDHTSQEDWTPDAAPSLWVKVSDPTEEWPAWSQPVSALDTYPAGAKTSHNGKHWISDLDNNVWEPGQYGWTEVTQEA